MSWIFCLKGYEIGLNNIYKISWVCINQCLERRIRNIKMPKLNCVSWIIYLQGYEIGLYQLNNIYKISCVCINQCLERRLRDFKMPKLNCVSSIFYSKNMRSVYTNWIISNILLQKNYILTISFLNKNHILPIYIIKKDICIYVAFSQPNGWTDELKFFVDTHGLTWGAIG